MTHRDGLTRLLARSRTSQRCGVSSDVRDAVQKPCEAAVSVAYAARQRASENLDDAPHRLRISSCPTDRISDLYGSFFVQLGIRAISDNFGVADDAQIIIANLLAE